MYFNEMDVDDSDDINVDDGDEINVDDGDDINVTSHSDRASALIQQCEPTFAALAKTNHHQLLQRKIAKTNHYQQYFFGN